jgi:hypothetical protein
LGIGVAVNVLFYFNDGSDVVSGADAQAIAKERDRQ